MNYQQQAVQKKPIAAAILSIIGGVIGLIMSLVVLVGVLYAMMLIGGAGYSGYGILGGVIAIVLGVALWILIASILVLVGGTKIYSRPTEHKKWGVIILVFSIIGLLLLAGTEWTGIIGLLGAIMGILGGILSLAFKPSPTQQTYVQQPYAQTGYPPPPPQASYQQQYPAQQQIRGVCPQCGRAIQEGVRFCPNCGQPLA